MSALSHCIACVVTGVCSWRVIHNDDKDEEDLEEEEMEEDLRRIGEAYEQEIAERIEGHRSFLDTLEITKCATACTPPKKTSKRKPKKLAAPGSKSARPDKISRAFEGIMGAGSKFKPMQPEAIKVVLTGCDTILTMPTGAPLSLHASTGVVFLTCCST